MTEYLTRETATPELCEKFWLAIERDVEPALHEVLDAGWRILPPKPEWTVGENENWVDLYRNGGSWSSFSKKNHFTREAVQAMADVLNGGGS